MAAYHLSSPAFSLENILEKITTADKAFPTQLHETTRWLASMRSDIFEAVVSRQPTLLLSMDLSHMTGEEYTDFVSRLLSIKDEFVYVCVFK